MLVSGLVSVLVISVAAGHVGLSHFIPTTEKTQNYYLAKDLVTCLLLHVAVPTYVIAKNAKMKHFILQKIALTKLSRVSKALWTEFKPKILPKKFMSEVQPVFVVTLPSTNGRQIERSKSDMKSQNSTGIQISML